MLKHLSPTDGGACVDTKDVPKLCRSVSTSQAKVGAKEELDALLPEYEGNPKPGFRKGVQDLGTVRALKGLNTLILVVAHSSGYYLFDSTRS